MMAEANLTSGKLNGTDKAAIFLLTLGQDKAASILQHMGPKEVQQLGVAMAALSNVSTEMVDNVMGDFVSTIKNQTALGIDSDEYIRDMLTNALGAEKAGGMIDRILLGRNSKGLEQLKWMDPRSIGDLIRNEHPQIIAIILSYLDSDQAAEILGYLPERTRPEIILRISTLEGVQPGALRELDEIMEKQLAGNANVQSSSIGGIQAAANILNFVDSSIEGVVMDQITESDPDLSQEIQDKMFVFENLLDIDDRGIQSLLREVSTDSLLLALRGADDALKEKIFKNMSKRAAEMLQDDLEAAAPAKLSDVEGAQKDILTIARRLADSGEISLGGGGGEELV